MMVQGRGKGSSQRQGGLVERIATAVVAGAATLSLSAPPARATMVSAETFGSQKGVLLEVKAGTGVGKEAALDVQYFTRIRRFRGYDGKNTAFMQNELSIGELAGFRLLGQGRLAGDELVPQAGVSYSRAVGGGKGYAALTSSIESPRLAELLLTASYPITPQIPLEAEHVLWVNENVLKGSSRMHLGYRILDNVLMGVAGEADYGKGRPPLYKGGVFLRLSGIPKDVNF